MKTSEVQHPLFMSGLVYINYWNKKGNITGLSLIANSGIEYRVKSNNTAKRLANYAWDEVEVEFFFINTYDGEPWIDVVHFKTTSQSISHLKNQVFNGVHDNSENKKNSQRFDIDSFVDQFEDLEAA